MKLKKMLRILAAAMVVAASPFSRGLTTAQLMGFPECYVPL